MATATQIYTIVNSMAEQALGIKGLEPTEASFVTVGQKVLSSQEDTDAFYKVLADRIGKTVFAIREYVANDKGLRKEGIDFGIALQKISFKLLKSSSNDTWTDKNTGINPFERFDTTVRQSLFKDFTTWEFDMSRPDVQLKTAFTSAASMGAYFESLMLNMSNSIEFAYENMCNVARGAFILRKKEKAINLLHEYNTLTNKGLTVASCMTDTDFLTYCAMTISLYSDRMTKFSTLFNSGEVEKHTPKKEQVLTVLDTFSKSMAYFLKSTLYHKDLVEMPLFSEVPYWQGSGENYAFDDISKVDLTIDGEEKIMTGVVAVMHDSMAIGTTIDNRRILTERNNRKEFTNYFCKADVGYYNDLDENGIVFYIAEV